MIDRDTKFLIEAYMNVGKPNFTDEIYNQIEKGLNQWGVFSSSEVIKDLIDGYEDSVEYRRDVKAPQEKKIIQDIQNRFLDKIKDKPFDIKRISFFLEINPVQKNNFKVGGFYDPKGDINEFRIILRINNVIKDKEDLKQEFLYIAVHELIHARQVYDKRLRGEVVTIPIISKNYQNYFKEYLMHEDELEAYATEYNYRMNNNPNRIKDFAIHIVNDAGFDINDEAIKSLFDDYLIAFTSSVKKYPWNGF